MGMYTEIYVNVDLKSDTPKSVIRVLEAMCKKEYGSDVLAEFPDRWGLLFNNGSCYTPSTEAGSLTFDSISEQYSLLAKGDIKNYGGEIEQFFEWLMPHIGAMDGEFIGYMRYEEQDKPDLFFKVGE